MFNKRNSITALILLVGWLAVQSTALHHEFSSEHLLSSGNHLCLSQATQLDDFVHADGDEKTLPLELDVLSLATEFVSSKALQLPKGNPPRAPPLYS
ncbi:hypothetical protein [Aliikangiella coralliicola]|uniref:Uncharacterized protein n=1 Tax=Aliikangiella coralliicola TaxID=2592383 RepID=A0A545TSU5_9GAMM|nr:hypothetical protein [Aliikangiella coralliicola]TQV80282.1 hypothetical protein FLL46_26560 [Aliikangiella coralliicola]